MCNKLGVYAVSIAVGTFSITAIQSSTIARLAPSSEVYLISTPVLLHIVVLQQVPIDDIICGQHDTTGVSHCVI